MQIYGSRVRDIAVYAWGVTILSAFPCHAIESPWFWGAVAGMLALSAATIVGLELLRLVAPGFTDNWWGPR